MATPRMVSPAKAELAWALYSARDIQAVSHLGSSREHQLVTTPSWLAQLPPEKL